MFNLILMPRPGVRYETNDAAMADWKAGKDFRIIGGGPYTSRRDQFRLAMLHNNVILSTNEGGVYVVKSMPVRNALDSIL